MPSGSDPIQLRSQDAAFPLNDAAVASGPLPTTAVYASWELKVPAETVAGNTQDPFFFAMASPILAGFYIDESTDELWWRILLSGVSGEDDLRALVPTDTWIACSVQFGAGAWASPRGFEITVDGLSSGLYSVTVPFYALMTFGWFNNGSNQPPDTVYSFLRNIQIGTSLGGSDILDYQGDLDVFGPDDDYQSGAGNVTVIADEWEDSPAEGVAASLTPTATESPVWTRLDDPDGI